MALIKHADITPQPGFVPASPRDDIARLAQLHREAEETALLANLLGRAPYAAVALAICAGLAVAFAATEMPATRTVTWLVLMLVGIGALVRSYGQAITAPFERAALKSFAQDLMALTLYMGFAWGAGAFLVLPGDVSPLVTLAFAGGVPALFAILLRDRDASLCFLAPVAGLSAFACLLRPLSGSVLTLALVFIACGAVAGAILLGQRLAARPLTDLQPG